MANEFFKTRIDVVLKKIKTTKSRFKKAISSYVEAAEESNKFADLRGLIEKQPDLFYGTSIYVSEGSNKNRDFFLRNILLDTYKTPRNKFVDYEHNVEGDNIFSNPKGYRIVGHIYDSMLATQDENPVRIPDELVIEDEDGKWFSEDSMFRGKKLDILVAWVIYKFQFPELAEIIEEKTAKIPEKFGVSMEVLFSDYKFRIGEEPNPEEDFEFDGNTLPDTVEARKGDPLAEELQELWSRGEGRTYKGKNVWRILGGSIIFSGIGITSNRANNRSYNISIGSYVSELEKENNELLPLILSVAKKSGFNMDQCKIENGEPDCNCVANAIQEEINLIKEYLKDFGKKKKGYKKHNKEVQKIWKTILGQIASLDEIEDEDDDNEVKQAQKRIRNLYENSLDDDLDKEEILEFLEEIEHIIRNPG